MTDPELVTAAIEAVTDGDVTAFAELLGHPHGRDVYAWRRGAVGLSTAVRALLRVIVAHPRAMRRWLQEAQP